MHVFHTFYIYPYPAKMAECQDKTVVFADDEATNTVSRVRVPWEFAERDPGCLRPVLRVAPTPRPTSVNSGTDSDSESDRDGLHALDLDTDEDETHEQTGNPRQDDRSTLNALELDTDEDEPQERTGNPRQNDRSTLETSRDQARVDWFRERFRNFHSFSEEIDNELRQAEPGTETQTFISLTRRQGQAVDRLTTYFSVLQIAVRNTLGEDSSMTQWIIRTQSHLDEAQYIMTRTFPQESTSDMNDID
jgi:hypothetical protein